MLILAFLGDIKGERSDQVVTPVSVELYKYSCEQEAR